jgi:transcriptional regulator with XRE-family HTH domain
LGHSKGSFLFLYRAHTKIKYIILRTPRKLIKRGLKRREMIPVALQSVVALQEKLRPFLNKEYRDEYLDGHVKAGIAYQIRAIREQLGLNQSEFATLIGKKQSSVSRLEDTDYSGTVNTLLEIAKSLNIAICIRFCSHSEMLQLPVSDESFRVDDVYKSVEKLRDRPSVGVHVPLYVNAEETTRGKSAWLPTKQANPGLFPGSETSYIENYILIVTQSGSRHST